MCVSAQPWSVYVCQSLLANRRLQRWLMLKREMIYYHEFLVVRCLESIFLAFFSVALAEMDEGIAQTRWPCCCGLRL